MNKTILISFVSTLLFSCSIFSDDICSVIGYHDPKTNTYYGPTFCEQTTINGIVVRGPLSADRSIINSITDVSGPVSSSGSQFENMVIENNHSTVKVNLNANSSVKNNIVFQGSHRGVVMLDASSSVKGKVVNGDIVHH